MNKWYLLPAIGVTWGVNMNIQYKYTSLWMLAGSLADEIKAQYEKNCWPHGKPPQMHTALDDLYSAERKENEVKEKAMSSDLFSESEDNKGGDGNDSESSGNGTRFANRTGIFSLDYPDSLKVRKGKGKKTKPTHVVPKKEVEALIRKILQHSEGAK